MKDRFDLVAVKEEGKIRLLEAPKFSHIKAGDRVELEDGTEAEIVGSRIINMDYDEEEFKFAMAVAGATWPLEKVKARIYKEVMKYEEDDE